MYLPKIQLSLMTLLKKIHEGVELSEIEALINEDHAEPLYFEHQLVGCVKPAHDIDVNLSSHIMHENLMSKASSVLATSVCCEKCKELEKSDVEYVIDCAEEACGDMNQHEAAVTLRKRRQKLQVL